MASNDKTKQPGAYRVQRDREGGAPWLWIVVALLALLALGGLLWWFVADDDGDVEVGTGDVEAGAVDDEPEPTSDPPTTGPPTTEPPAQNEARCGRGGTITDIGFFSQDSDADISGCPVDLASVKVVEAVSDKLFTVGTEARPIFVSVGDETSQPPAGTEGKYEINGGETLAVTGKVQKINDAAEAQRMFEIDAATADELASQGYFVLATGIEEQPR